MGEKKKDGQARTCPRCGSHCLENALKCGKGRKYFRTADGGQKHPKDGLARLLRRCGRFARHTQWDETVLFQALSDGEKAALQDLLGKLEADWQVRSSEGGAGRKEGKRHKHKKHHKDGKHRKGGEQEA